MTSTEDSERSAPASGPGAPTQREKKRVLIIEDNTDAGRVLTALVTRMGHDVQYAINGNVGLAYAKLFNPDVILLDLGLPGMSGYEVCRRLKREPSSSGARVIIVSALGDEDTRARAKAAGANLYLAKPVEPTVLEELLSF